jgi:hypothetical protein
MLRRLRARAMPVVNDLHIVFVIVNAPEPVQPELPARVQPPEMVFPLSVPDSIRLFPEGGFDWTSMANWPLGLPLRSPPRVIDPVSVSPSAKHAEIRCEVET